MPGKKAGGLYLFGRALLPEPVSAWFASTVVSGYIAAVVGIHRFNVWRMRRAAEGFTALDRLDWDALLSGLLPDPPRSTRASLKLEDGSPSPLRLEELSNPRARFLKELLFGAGSSEPPSDVAFAEAGLSGGEASWAKTLWQARRAPEQALQWLEQAKVETAAEVYLREHLALSHQTNIFNRELVSYESTRRLNAAIARFGDRPELYFARARAKALIGSNRKAIDDLARAVYFSRQAPFYLAAVLDTPYVAEARPPLAFQCRQALDAEEENPNTAASNG